MINKKINRLLSSVLGVALIIGIMEIPVFADDSVQTTSGYSTNTNMREKKNYIVNKDNSIEINGLKISIDNIVATKHKLEGTVIIENQKAFDELKGRYIITQLTYGDNNYNSEGVSYGKADEKTLKIDFERKTDDVLPEKGELRIDMVIPEYKVNVGLDANVDFSESFKNSIEKDMSVKIPELNFTINKLESNILGTQITFSKTLKDDSDKNDYLLMKDSSGFILKVGDKMYATMTAGSNGNGMVITETNEAEAVTYEKIKGQNNISLIPIVCDMTNEEVNKTYENNYKNESSTVTTNNVTYLNNFDFSDGSKGEIYNIERDDNSIKIYCKGATENESLLMASTMSMYYKIEDGKASYNNYDSRKNMSFYKDSKDSLGYIVEFDNVEKDKAVELNFENIIKQIDKFKIGNEVKLSE